MKQTLKNLWSQRAQNVWLFAELVVVCFVAWTQIDPIVVRLFYQNQPTGFDIDRLVVAEARLYKVMGENIYEHIGEEYYEQIREQFTREMKQLKQHLLELDEVAYVSFLDGIKGYPRMNKHYRSISLPNDTIHIDVPWCFFDIEEDFFETFGIQPVPGSPSQHELSMNSGGGQNVIITRSLAERIYGSPEAAMGKTLDPGITYIDGAGNKNLMIYTIIGVVEDVSTLSGEYSTWMAFCPNGRFDDYHSEARLVIRLKPGVNMKRFVEEQTYHMGELASEHFVICSFVPYVDASKNMDSFDVPDFNAQSDYDFNLSVATAIFFLVNLCLGVIGTFWMQTKRRTEESGIMRAFGATRGRVLLLFLAEGWVLTTLSMFITCVLYLNYVKMGLGALCIPPHAPDAQPDPTWVADKPLHFCLIAGIVYLVIMTVVSIGILIPSWNICRMKPAEALRDE
ncbi:MAG: ABC transporter permease [Bacteroidaceae bacterium]|nr:ABC transporter permease [Bacteroidaceae bacterium]